MASEPKICVKNLKSLFCLGGNGSCGGGRREGERGSDSGRSEKARGVVAGFGAEETVDDMAASDGVGRPPVGRRRRRWRWRCGGVLYTKCELYGDCGEKEEQEIGWLFDHYKASKGFLAFGLIYYKTKFNFGFEY